LEEINGNLLEADFWPGTTSVLPVIRNNRGAQAVHFRYTDFLGTDPTLEVEWLQGCQQTIESRRIGVKAIGAPIPSVPFRASHLLR
jgi:hypothetical protein